MEHGWLTYYIKLVEKESKRKRGYLADHRLGYKIEI